MFNKVQVVVEEVQEVWRVPYHTVQYWLITSVLSHHEIQLTLPPLALIPIGVPKVLLWQNREYSDFALRVP